MPITPNPKPARTVALCYSRKSDIRDGVDLVSIIWQDDVVERECKRRGWTPEWYRDTARHNSGRHDNNRKQWTALRRRVSDADVVAVVVAIQDRASRSVRHTAELVEACIKHHVDLIAPADGLDTTRTGGDAQTIATINLRASFAQLESDLASQRLKRRVAQYHEAGIPWGTAPFGMRRAGKGLAAILEGNEDAPTVAKVLALYASGLSFEDTVTACDKAGLMFRSRQNKPVPMIRESVRTIVGNILTYTGHIPKDGWDAKATHIDLAGDGGLLARYARASGAVRSPAIRPIISDALAESVIERRHSTQYANTGNWTPLLTPIVWWKGKRLRAEGRSYGQFYVVRSAAGPHIDAEVAENNLISRLAGLDLPQQMIEQIRQTVITRTSDKHREELHAQLDRLRAERSTLLALRLKKQVSDDDYTENYSRIEQALASTQAQLDTPTTIEQSLNSLADIATAIKQMSRPARRRTIHRMFTKIVLDDDGEVIGVTLKAWLYAALSEMKDGATTPVMPKVGTWNNFCKQILFGSSTWLLPRIKIHLNNSTPAYSMPLDGSVERLF